jgi:hypothetical protein
MSAAAPTRVVLNPAQRAELARDLARELAPLLAELLGAAPRRSRLIDAATLAGMLGVSRHAIYQHSRALGAIRIGDGPRGRLRFDPDTALEAWIHRSSRRNPQDPETPAAAGKTRPRRRPSTGSKAGLLPIEGDLLPLATEPRAG